MAFPRLLSMLANKLNATGQVPPNGISGAGTAGNLLTSNGTDWVSNSAVTNNLGFLNVPQNAQTGSYTAVIGDNGRHIFHASGAGAATYTIPANSSVAFPLGTILTFINMSSGTVSIACGDTLTQVVTGATGTRSLAQYGTASAIKITSTGWLISGAGIT